MPRSRPFACLTLAALVLAACNDSGPPTQPETGGAEPAATALALASNTWTPRASMPRPAGTSRLGPLRTRRGNGSRMSSVARNRMKPGSLP